jgi:hypothetical protein
MGIMAVTFSKIIEREDSEKNFTKQIKELERKKI